MALKRSTKGATFIAHEQRPEKPARTPILIENVNRQTVQFLCTAWVDKRRCGAPMEEVHMGQNVYLRCSGDCNRVIACNAAEAFLGKRVEAIQAVHP